MEPTQPTTPPASDQPANIVQPTTAPTLNNKPPETTPPIPTPSAPEPVQPAKPTPPSPSPTIGSVSAQAPEPAPAPESPKPPVPTPVLEPTTPAPAPTAPTSTGDSNSNRTRKVLLVEDDDSLASVYQTRLQAEGFDIKRVPNGEDALAAATAYKPDLVLLDVMMPKVSGFDVLDILRNTPETTNVKVIMLTALSQDADKERADKLGVDEYLVKSQVVIADVVDRIKKHLGV